MAPVFRGMRLCRVPVLDLRGAGAPRYEGRFSAVGFSWHAALPRVGFESARGGSPTLRGALLCRRFPSASSAPVFTDFLSDFTKISPRKALQDRFWPQNRDFGAFIGFFGPILPFSGDFWAVKRFGIRRGVERNFTEIFSEYLLARALASWL